MKIYLDNAATSRMSIKTIIKTLPFLRGEFFNSNSRYKRATVVGKKVKIARSKIAKLLNVQPTEIFFTSGGCEADSWVLKGTTVLRGKMGRIIISPFEHPAILNSCKQLENLGYEVVCAPLNEQGIIDIASFESLITDDTLLVSIMYANNEIGTIQPVKELCEIAHRHGCLFHTDAVQIIGQEEIDVTQTGVDFLSLSAHKFGGPKGMGVLYIKSSVQNQIVSLINGGEQEGGLRGGTTNVFGAIALAESLEQHLRCMRKWRRKIERNKNRIWSYLKQQGCELVGPELNSKERLPLTMGVLFPFSESLVFLFDEAGIEVSSGSACSSAASGLPRSVELIKGEVGNRGFVRFSFPYNLSFLKTQLILFKLRKIFRSQNCLIF